MTKKSPLVVGQKVWLETISRHGCNVKFEQVPEEMIVLEANKTSAYIWFNVPSQNVNNVRYKVNQRTYQVKYAVPDGRSYRLWLSKEAYEINKAEELESDELRRKLHNTIDAMSLNQLRELSTTLFE